MSNFISYRILRIGAVVSLLLLAAACSKPEEKEVEAAVPVQTAVAQRAPIVRIIRAPAILYAVAQASIMPKISAPIRAFYINRGDHVRQGQLLAQLEDRDLTAAALEAKGQFDQAEANYRSIAAASLPDEIMKSQGEVQAGKEALDAAQKVYESRKKLYEEGALPRKQLDEASVALVQARSTYEVAVRHRESLQKIGKEEQIKTAQAQVEAARGHWQAAQAQVEYAKIISPLNGVVTDRPLYPGETANSGSPLLTVMDVSRIIARANVSVNELRHIKVGNNAVMKVLDANEEFQGKVTVVSPALDPNSTTAEVWVLMPNQGDRLKPGTTVQISIQAETIQEAVVIPAVALLPTSEGAGNRVFVIGPGSRAQEKTIDIGIREGDQVQVLKGLQPGAQVVTVGGMGLKDKSAVTIENGPGEKSKSHDDSKSEK
jgi:multidrug efflux pump subunit AcrA (membrane-fusion protein)